MNSLKKIQKFEFDVSPHVTIFWFIKKNIWLSLRFNWAPMGSWNVSTYIQLDLNTIELCSFTTRCLSQMRLSKQATLKLLYYHDWAKWLQNLLVSVKHREGGCPVGTTSQDLKHHMVQSDQRVWKPRERLTSFPPCTPMSVN